MLNDDGPTTARDRAVKSAAAALLPLLVEPVRLGDMAEAVVDAVEPVLLADAQREIEHLRGIIERVAWRTARVVGAVSTEEIEPLPEGYDLEDLHARLQTQIGIERLESAHEIEQLRQALASERYAASIVAAHRIAAVLRTRCKCAEFGTDNPAQCEYEDAAQIAETMFAQPDPEETP